MFIIRVFIYKCEPPAPLFPECIFPCQSFIAPFLCTLHIHIYCFAEECTVKYLLCLAEMLSKAEVYFPVLCCVMLQHHSRTLELQLGRDGPRAVTVGMYSRVPCSTCFCPSAIHVRIPGPLPERQTGTRKPGLLPRPRKERAKENGFTTLCFKNPLVCVT